MPTHRSYVIQPKPTATPVITRIIEHEILPMLNSQKGLRDGPVVVHMHTPLSSHFKLVGYDGACRSLQPFVVSEVLKAFSKVVGDTSEIKALKLPNPTLHNITAKKD